MWGFDDKGSSPMPCQDQYRGVSPFSEKETQAIRKFVTENDVKLGVNYDGVGNYYLTPVMYTTEDNLTAYAQSSDYPAYASIAKDSQFPSSAKVGTISDVLGKATNGGFVDWMYGQGIPAYEVGVGLNTTSSITGTNLVPAFQSHWPGLLRIVERAVPFPRLTAFTVTEATCDQVVCGNSSTSLSVVQITVVVSNIGFTNLTGVDIRVTVEIPASNYSFALQPVWEASSCLDIKSGTAKVNMTADVRQESDTLFDFKLPSDVLANRTEAFYYIALERAKLPNMTSFPPIIANFTVTALPQSVNTVTDWMSGVCSKTVSFSLSETVPVTIVPTVVPRNPDNSSDEGKDYSPIIIGLSIAGSVLLLSAVAVSAFFIWRRCKRRPEKEMRMIPPADNQFRGLEPSGITLQMDMTGNQA